MKLSIYVATRNGSSRNPSGTFEELLQSFRELADELVVLVDDTSDDDTADVARKYTKKVHSFVHDPLFIEMQRQAFSRCSGDWIFAADDDDRLSSRWSRATFERLMDNHSVTHYWVPTRYLVNEEAYLSTAPYIGHFSAQFYRNIESIAVLPTTLHQQIAFAGEPAYLAGLYTDAMNFAWHDRQSREAKVRTYDEAHDEATTNFDQTRFYLYEDYYFETEPIDDSIAPSVMEPVGEGTPPGVHVSFLKEPRAMTAGQTYWVPVRIVNNSHVALLPQSEFIRWGELALRYRWLSQPESAMSVAPLRTPFPARLLPGHQHDALVRVQAPARAGTERLQIDIFRENRTWLSETGDAGSFEKRDVHIRTLVWPPVIGSQSHRG